LINFYLRFTISQERLSELAIVSIENEILVELEYNNLISNFTSQKEIKKQLNEKKKYYIES
jgi:hypothetical protein